MTSEEYLKSLFRGSLSLILCLILISSCTETEKKEKNNKKESPENLSELEIFLGEWIVEKDSTIFMESWVKRDDAWFSGIGKTYDLNNNLIFSEELNIELKDSGIFYSARIMDQNEGNHIYFSLVQQSDSVFVFINEAHDYPQRLTYSFKNNDLDIFIYGSQNGEELYDTLYLKKREAFPGE